MKVEILASGSQANCYVLRGAETLLLDCGMPIRKTLTLLNFQLPGAILVTHEHGDHSKAVEAFLKRGVEVFMTAGTAQALALKRHNLHVIQVGEKFPVGKFSVEVLPSKHDAAEPVNFIVSDERDRLLYVTDSGEVPAVGGDFTKILIEANHRREVLLESYIDEAQKLRILQNHLSVERAIDFLKKFPAAKVWLIHISTRHGDLSEFAREASQLAGVEVMNI